MVGKKRDNAMRRTRYGRKKSVCSRVSPGNGLIFCSKVCHEVHDSDTENRRFIRYDDIVI
jgi:hypothetical protein